MIANFLNMRLSFFHNLYPYFRALESDLLLSIENNSSSIVKTQFVALNKFRAQVVFCT